MILRILSLLALIALAYMGLNAARVNSGLELDQATEILLWLALAAGLAALAAGTLKKQPPSGKD